MLEIAEKNSDFRGSEGTAPTGSRTPIPLVKSQRHVSSEGVDAAELTATDSAAVSAGPSAISDLSDAECRELLTALWPSAIPVPPPSIPAEDLASAIDGLAGNKIAITPEESLAIRRIGYPKCLKSWAQKRINILVSKGRVKRAERCERCKRTKKGIEGHHPDYAKPYTVEWLCESCHLKLHAEDKRILVRVLQAVSLALFRGLHPQLVVTPAESEVAHA